MIAARALIFAGATAIFLPGVTLAQDSKNQGYLVDSYGNGITTSSNTGLCVHSSDWTLARSVEPCDPVARKAEVAAPAPSRVAAIPSAPPAEPAPVRALPQKISFSADALFDFDKSVLKPEGKSMLDDLARDLNGASYDAILAIGHADRIGSNAYNQKLSERRAHAVKDYLVSRDIAAGRVNAEGRGETQPVTKAGDCQGAMSARLRACLQPDRRVDVEVTATKTPIAAL